MQNFLKTCKYLKKIQIFQLNNCYKFYNSNCYSVVELNSARTLFGNEQKLKFSDLRIVGIPMQLGFYDSHLLDRNCRHKQATIPTILLLPSGESTIDSYHILIESLTKKNVRVLALEFPGTKINFFYYLSSIY
jgi:hypothetical protein